jgi:hypothetical protein
MHRKKRFTSFPSPAGMSLTKLPLGRNNSVMTSLFRSRESLGSDILAGDGKLANLFLRCGAIQILSCGTHFSQIFQQSLTFGQAIYHSLFTSSHRKVEGNAKCRHLKKLMCKGPLRQVFICLRPRTPIPPLHTVYLYTLQYTYSHIGGGGELNQREG